MEISDKQIDIHSTIDRFTENTFKTEVIPQDEFNQKSPEDQFLYLDHLQRQGILSVQKASKDWYKTSSLGQIQQNTQHYFSDLVGPNYFKEPLTQKTTEPVEITSDFLLTTIEHRWFRPEIAGNLDSLSSQFKEEALIGFQLGVQSIAKNNGISEDEARKLYLEKGFGKNIITLYDRAIKRGLIEKPEKIETPYTEIIKQLTSKKMLLNMMQGKLTDGEQTNTFDTAYVEAVQNIADRAAVVKEISEIQKQMEPLYRAIAPLYIDFSHLVLNYVKDTGKPVVFLFRDGQFLRKIVNDVRKKEEPDIDQGLLKEGMLSRTVLRTVDEKREDLTDYEENIYRRLWFIASNIPELKKLSEEVKDLENQFDAEVGKYGGQWRQAEIKRQKEDKIAKFINIASDRNLIPSDIVDDNLGIRAEKQKIYQEKKDTLYSYLDSLGCFEPQVVLADTGVGGRVMHEISKAREEYYDTHINDNDFMQKIKEAYNTDPDRLRDIYIKKAISTFMVITSRNVGSNYSGYTREDQNGLVYSPISALKLLSLGYKPDKDGLEDHPEMELTHVIESRLNGYMEPIKEVIEKNSKFSILQGETVQDKNENVSGAILARKRANKIGGVDITGDPGRIALNFAAMRYVRDEVNKILSGQTDYQPKANDAHITNAMQELINAGPLLRAILRYKTPTLEALDNYIKSTI